MGPEKGCGEEEQETQHAVVALMASNCCTWLEPRSADWRDKHVVVGVKVFFVLFFTVSEEDNGHGNGNVICNTCSASVQRRRKKSIEF